jgi:hypothetical protein
MRAVILIGMSVRHPKTGRSSTHNERGLFIPPPCHIRHKAVSASASVQHQHPHADHSTGLGCRFFLHLGKFSESANLLQKIFLIHCFLSIKYSLFLTI